MRLGAFKILSKSPIQLLLGEGGAGWGNIAFAHRRCRGVKAGALIQGTMRWHEDSLLKLQLQSLWVGFNFACLSMVRAEGWV